VLPCRNDGASVHHRPSIVLVMAWEDPTMGILIGPAGTLVMAWEDRTVGN
jgi:hypothetical protein